MKRLLRALSLPLLRGVALALLLAVAAVVAMSSSTRLHEAAHDDADHADHDCVVTLFASGSATDQVIALEVLAGMYLPWAETLRLEATREVFLTQVEGRIRERAPPVSAA